MMLGATDVRTLPAISAQWRREVQKRGKYWQWRKGRGANRQARYGGKFETLPEERKRQYEQNKAVLQMRKTRTQHEMPKPESDHGTRSVDDVGISGELLPIGGLERGSVERR